MPLCRCEQSWPLLLPVLSSPLCLYKLLSVLKLHFCSALSWTPLTDNMLWSLFTLTTALTCVSAAMVLTQRPPVVTVRRGETASMDCNLGSVTDFSTLWYKQIPGAAPKHVLRFRDTWSKVSYGSGFSAPKFTSTHQSKLDYRLIINNVDEGDSAVYYCTTWDTTVNEYVFGQGTKLIVTDCSPPPPVLTVFPPSHTELQSNKATLLCVSRQTVSFGHVTWLAAGSPVSSEFWDSSTVPQPDQTFQMSSSLSIQASDWSANKVYTCRVSVGSQTSEKHISKSECSSD